MQASNDMTRKQNLFRESYSCCCGHNAVGFARAGSKMKEELTEEK